MATLLICDRCKANNDDGKRFISFTPKNRSDLVLIRTLRPYDLCDACWVVLTIWMKEMEI